jgi:hypothetical protein
MMGESSSYWLDPEDESRRMNRAKDIAQISELLSLLRLMLKQTLRIQAQIEDLISNTERYMEIRK